MALNNEALVLMGMRLRQSQPELWNDFLIAVRDWSNQTAQAMVTADPQHLMRAQGMAIAARELSSIMWETPKLFEQLQRRPQKAGPNG